MQVRILPPGPIFEISCIPASNRANKPKAVEEPVLAKIMKYEAQVATLTRQAQIYALKNQLTGERKVKG